MIKLLISSTKGFFFFLQSFSSIELRRVRPVGQLLPSADSAESGKYPGMAARIAAWYNNVMSRSSSRLGLVAGALVLTQFLLACTSKLNLWDLFRLHFLLNIGLSVVAKIALAHVHWLVFAFLREVMAGPILAIIGWTVERMNVALRMV